MALVRIPTQLRKLTEGRAEEHVSGDTLEEVLGELEIRCPGIAARVLDDTGGIRRFVNLYVDGEDARFQSGLETRVETDSVVSIIPAVAGGAHLLTGGSERRARATLLQRTFAQA